MAVISFASDGEVDMRLIGIIVRSGNPGEFGVKVTFKAMDNVFGE